MARRTQTYAIRLAVEGGGQVKAELVSVGQSGEQSLKRIESAGEPASGRLKGLGRQAELLRTGIRTPGGPLAGARRSAGSPPWLIARSRRPMPSARPPIRSESGWRRSRSCASPRKLRRRATDARHGAAALHPPGCGGCAGHRRGEGRSRPAGDRAAGSGGHLRRSEDLLGDVADAFARIEDPAERVRLAFKLFDSEGVALVNLLSDGGGALEEMRERARGLGIVLDEHLVRDAERRGPSSTRSLR